MEFLLRFRRPLVVLIHLALVLLSNYLAFWLRFDGGMEEGLSAGLEP